MNKSCKVTFLPFFIIGVVLSLLLTSCERKPDAGRLDIQLIEVLTIGENEPESPDEYLFEYISTFVQFPTSHFPEQSLSLTMIHFSFYMQAETRITWFTQQIVHFGKYNRALYRSTRCATQTQHLKNCSRGRYYWYA